MQKVSFTVKHKTETLAYVGPDIAIDHRLENILRTMTNPPWPRASPAKKGTGIVVISVIALVVISVSVSVAAVPNNIHSNTTIVLLIITIPSIGYVIIYIDMR